MRSVPLLRGTFIAAGIRADQLFDALVRLAEHPCRGRHDAAGLTPQGRCCTGPGRAFGRYAARFHVAGRGDGCDVDVVRGGVPGGFGRVGRLARRAMCVTWVGAGARGPSWDG